MSSCSVYDEILSDRPLDETLPFCSTSHYGAHNAAIEKLVHSCGLGLKFSICALRPTGIYGLDEPAAGSKWFDVVQSVVQGEPVQRRRRGKDVHAADIAKASAYYFSPTPR